MFWSEASKIVGWDEQKTDYPKMAQLDDAIEFDDLVSLIRWNRFLPSPQNPTQALMIEKIVQACIILRNSY